MVSTVTNEARQYVGAYWIEWRKKSVAIHKTVAKDFVKPVSGLVSRCRLTKQEVSEIRQIIENGGCDQVGIRGLNQGL